jgi:glycosyltransferase involved in cell wall biosynthesis
VNLRAEDITIAITVYDRRDYVVAAIDSALAQTVPVKVMVVEDCGPDPGLREFILQKFGGRIEYLRNPQNRGLFDNWNACLEYCRTPWLSILHDDDLLYPHFVETMLALAQQAPGRGLYYGRRNRLEPDGKIYPPTVVSWQNWRDLDSSAALLEQADESVLGYPGNLIRVEAARGLGGFRKHFRFTGDWDMWMRLVVHFGGIETATVVAVGRCHEDFGRASSGVTRRGWKWVLDNVQRKRNLNLLKTAKGISAPFDRAKLVRRNPVPMRQMLRQAGGFSRGVLVYNWWLLTQSTPPHWHYALLQQAVRWFGPQFLRRLSRCATRLNRT